MMNSRTSDLRRAGLPRMRYLQRMFDGLQGEDRGSLSSDTGHLLTTLPFPLDKTPLSPCSSPSWVLVFSGKAVCIRSSAASGSLVDLRIMSGLKTKKWISVVKMDCPLFTLNRIRINI
jgi:hypothetical protein